MAILIPAQIRAGRGLIGWPALVLADRAGVHITTVQRLERAHGSLRGAAKTVDKIRRALETAGVIFVSDDDEGPGVRLKRANSNDRMPSQAHRQFS